jgi:hypothetical protein
MMPGVIGVCLNDGAIQKKPDTIRGRSSISKKIFNQNKNIVTKKD